jgi:hypothetical protein
MTLRDKIRQCPDKQGWTNPNYGRAENIEKIADNYAIEFKKWGDLNKSIIHTDEELLEIFKKEKGL